MVHITKYLVLPTAPVLNYASIPISQVVRPQDGGVLLPA